MKRNIFNHRWLHLLVSGVLLFILAEIALVTTQNALFFPTVIILGAFVVPVTFVTYFYEYVRDRDIPMPTLTMCFVFGGLIGVIAAGLVEYQTLRSLDTASLFGVGLIEETAKLIVPVAMFVRGKYRHEADGLLFGVAAGMGFAALETMGYAVVNMVKSGGSVSAVQQVLLVRGLLSPSGHAAWTGFVCAILWRQRQLTGNWLGWPVIGAYVLAVVLHAVWDIISSINVQTGGQLALVSIFLLALIAISLTLLFWRFRQARNAVKVSGASTQAV